VASGKLIEYIAVLLGHLNGNGLVAFNDIPAVSALGVRLRKLSNVRKGHRMGDQIYYLKLRTLSGILSGHGCICSR
jgi:hypothetical protein